MESSSTGSITQNLLQHLAVAFAERNGSRGQRVFRVVHPLEVEMLGFGIEHLNKIAAREGDNDHDVMVFRKSGVILYQQRLPRKLQEDRESETRTEVV